MPATLADPLARSTARLAPDFVRSTLVAVLPRARWTAPRTCSFRLPVALPTAFLAEPTA